MSVQPEIESHLKRWVDARIIDFSTADRIREYESTGAPNRQTNWMVILATAFGAIMLGAGILLFVAAHWDELSPTQRFLLVLTMVAGFHVAAGLLIERLRALGVALHAIGTIALGAGIFLAGQIFNLQEHWPGGVMLWAAGALIAWFILRDTAQATLAALLIPGWIAGELAVRYERFIGGDTAAAQFAFMIAILYLGVRTSDRHFSRALHIVGGIAVVPAFFWMTESARYISSWRSPLTPSAPLRFLMAALALGLPLLAAWLTRGRRAAFELGLGVWALIATVLASQHSETFASLALYGWCALAAVVMVAWGVRDQSPTHINMGVLSFALTICFFYFSSVVDKLGRAASLIAFGMTFLLGGWYLEKLRRKLILRSKEGAR
jgi:uncharacterized membrane protein